MSAVEHLCYGCGRVTSELSQICRKCSRPIRCQCSECGEYFELEEIEGGACFRCRELADELGEVDFN